MRVFCKIGVHNGWRYVTRPDTFHLIAEATTKGQHSSYSLHQPTAQTGHSRTQSLDRKLVIVQVIYSLQYRNHKKVCQSQFDVSFLLCCCNSLLRNVVLCITRLQTGRPRHCLHHQKSCATEWSEKRCRISRRFRSRLPPRAEFRFGWWCSSPGHKTTIHSFNRHTSSSIG